MTHFRRSLGKLHMKRLKQLKHRSEQVAGRRIRKLAGTLDPKKHEDRLKKLEDIESIRRLKAAYCAACDDDHDGEAIGALFIEDGTWQQSGKVGSAGIEPKRGRNAIGRYFEKYLTKNKGNISK